jgi:hypothetical protein
MRKRLIAELSTYLPNNKKYKQVKLVGEPCTYPTHNTNKGESDAYP